MTPSAATGVVAMLLSLSAAPVIADRQASARRVITLSVLPESAPPDTRPNQIVVLEDGTATLNLPDLGQFGFSPSIRKDESQTVVVTISDTGAKPSRDLGSVDVPIGGKAVRSKTKPQFEIKVVSVVQRK